MKLRTSKLLLALATSATSCAASASGFQLLEMNASGLGNAYAGSAAVADNASTIFFNPAGMTQLSAREYSIGIAAIKPSLEFNDSGSSVGVLAGSGNGGNAGTLALVPNGHLSWAYNKDLYLGIGFGAPFGLATKYDKPWLGAAQATSFEIATYNLNPSIAYRINETVSIGGGLNWQRLEAEYQRVAAVVAPITAATPLKLSLDDQSLGWNLGALFQISPATRVGLSYRSRIKYEATGDIVATGPNAPFNASISSDARANIELPDTFILSATHHYSNQWETLTDLSWTGWGDMSKIEVMRTSGAGAGTLAQTLDTNFRNTWRAAVGANYKIADDTKLKFGLAYDQTPIKNAASRLVSLPENNHVWLSFGSQWRPSKVSALDLGVTYLYMKDAAIDNDQSLQGLGRITGTYQDSAWILGAQYSASF